MIAVSPMSGASPAQQAMATDRRDAELMRAIVKGDASAFESLYSELYPRLFRFLQRMVGQADQAEDLVNETMLVLWERPEGFDFSCKVSTWVFGIAYRKALKAVRSTSRSEVHLSVDDLADILPETGVSTIGQLELDQVVSVAFESLPPEQRAVIELTFFEALHYREIAAILGCPENTVKTRMFHARKKLLALRMELRPGDE